MRVCCRVFLDKAQMDPLPQKTKPYCECVCVFWLQKSVCQTLHLQIAFYLLLHRLLVLFFFCSDRDVFSRFACAAHPPLPLILLGVILRFGLSWQQRTQGPPLCLFAKFLLLQAPCTLACWDREDLLHPSPPSRPRPHHQKLAGVKEFSEIQARYESLPVNVMKYYEWFWSGDPKLWHMWGLSLSGCVDT